MALWDAALSWGADGLIWRDVLRLVLLSAGLTLASTFLFQRNAPGLRAFVVLGSVSLLLAPVFVGWFNPIIPVGIENPVPVGLEQALPLWLVAIVAGISLIGLIRTAVNVSRTRHAVAHLRLAQDNALIQMAQPMVKTLGLKACPRFRIADQADGRLLPNAPFAVRPGRETWCCRPTTLGYDKATLRAGVAHELVHLARRDDVCCVLVRLVVSGYWFLPWLRSLERRYWLAMEHSCDDRAADFLGTDATTWKVWLGWCAALAWHRASGADEYSNHRPCTQACSTPAAAARVAVWATAGVWHRCLCC